MIVNTLDSMINCYDMYDVLNQPPVRFYGHKSSKEFYGIYKYLLNLLVRANIGLNDNFIISGSEDGQVYLWDIKS